MNNNYEIVTTRNGKLKSVPVLNKDVTISKLLLEHCPKCKPSAIQKVVRRCQSGVCAKDISIHTIYSLCSLMKGDRQVKISTLMNMTHPFFPSKINKIRNYAVCFKSKVRKLIPILDRT